MTEGLTLAEFPAVATAQWEEAVRKDLKGKDPGRKLFYRAEDLRGLEYLDARGMRGGNSWQICEIVRVGGRSIAEALDALPAERDAVHFEAGERAIEVVEALIGKPDAQPASVDYAPLGDFDRAAELVRRSLAAPGFRPITIGAHRFGEAGASVAQELGFALAEGVEILARITEDAAAALAFSFSIGSSYFLEIAKLRAARTLWARVVESFAPDSAESAKMMIHARTSHWTKTIYDPHVNLLRATTEAMAAVIGGADWLYVEPFDATYREPGEFSRRLARNTQLILRHEALLDRAVDAAGGSYYLEVLTDSVAREAWKLLQEIEAGGGFLRYAASGEPARARAMVGTNRYPNPRERMLPEIERADAAPRAASGFEEMRLRTERYAARTGRAPRILLLESGDPKMRKARSGFAANFFGCAGFDIETADALTGDPDAVVLCSSDAEYATLAPRVIRQLRDAGKATPVIVAGNPGVIEGVADNVHLRSNMLETLRAWQERLEVRA